MVFLLGFVFVEILEVSARVEKIVQEVFVVQLVMQVVLVVVPNLVVAEADLDFAFDIAYVVGVYFEEALALE